MKAFELRELPEEEIRKRIKDEEENPSNLRFQKATSQLESPIRIRTVRRDIARMKTVLREKEARRLTAVAEPAAAAEKKADTVTFEQVRAVTMTVKAIGGFDRLNELLGLIKEVGGVKKFKDLAEAMTVPETDAIPF